MDYSLFWTFAWRHIFKLCLCAFVVKSNYAMKGKDFVAKKTKNQIKTWHFGYGKHVILINDLTISINRSVWNFNGNLLVLTSKSNNITFFCNNLV
jgi:hypothetical protein